MQIENLQRFEKRGGVFSQDKIGQGNIRPLAKFYFGKLPRPFPKTQCIYDIQRLLFEANWSLSTSKYCRMSNRICKRCEKNGEFSYYLQNFNSQIVRKM